MDDDMLRLHHAVVLLAFLAACTAPLPAEIVDPSGENNSTNFQDNSGTQCDSADCTVHIEDNDTSTAICDDSGGSAQVCILIDFDSPSANPTTGTDAQTIQGTASQHDDANNGSSCAHVSGSGSPTLDIEIYCNGTASGVSPVSADLITADNEAFSGTFTFGTTIGTATCAADGSDLQFNVCGTRGGGSPGDRRWLAIEELEWDATVSAAGRTRRTF